MGAGDLVALCQLIIAACLLVWFFLKIIDTIF
jgi:hypothetical protein